MRIEPDESSDTSGMDTAVIEGIRHFCLWPDLLDEEDCSMSNVGSNVDNSLCMSEQDSLSYMDVASIGDFDSEDPDEDIGFNSNEGSVEELEWNTWDEACALEFQNASGVFPQNSTVVHPAVNIKDNVYNMEEAPVLEPLEYLNCFVTDHVDIDSFWMALWDADGTLGYSCRPRVTSWRTVFRSVARLSCRPAFVEDCSRLFRNLGRMCVLDVHADRWMSPRGAREMSPGGVCCPRRCRRATGNVVV